jgi:hypothetical protein
MSMLGGLRLADSYMVRGCQHADGSDIILNEVCGAES